MTATTVPIPLPAIGALEPVVEHADAIFNWEYALHREALAALYEKGKRMQWNAATDVDPEAFPEFFPAEAFNAMLNPPQRLELRELRAMRVHQLGCDRLLMHEVWERLGFDVDAWVAWSLQTPFMGGFRQLLFSKIVPNLKRLGLLTPRVRAAFEQIGVLHFEHMPDSTQDETVTLPPMMAEFLAGMSGANGAG